MIKSRSFVEHSQTRYNDKRPIHHNYATEALRFLYCPGSDRCDCPLSQPNFARALDDARLYR